MKIRAAIHIRAFEANLIVIDVDGEIEDTLEVNGNILADKIVEEINSGKFHSIDEALK